MVRQMLFKGEDHTVGNDCQQDHIFERRGLWELKKFIYVNKVIVGDRQGDKDYSDGFGIFVVLIYQKMWKIVSRNFVNYYGSSKKVIHK